jgi:DNA-binding NarL/FixJ family response regulator
MHIPVLVITSDDQPETRQRVMQLGAQGMIIKPATIDTLEDALRKAKVIE